MDLARNRNPEVLAWCSFGVYFDKALLRHTKITAKKSQVITIYTDNCNKITPAKGSADNW